MWLMYAGGVCVGDCCRGADPRNNFFVLNFRDRAGCVDTLEIVEMSGVGKGCNSLTILKTGDS